MHFLNDIPSMQLGKSTEVTYVLFETSLTTISRVTKCWDRSAYVTCELLSQNFLYRTLKFAHRPTDLRNDGPESSVIIIIIFRTYFDPSISQSITIYTPGPIYASTAIQKIQYWYNL
jgi:hypothetical protein